MRKRLVIFPLLALIIGAIIGIKSSFVFSPLYSKYVAIGILACIDSCLGGIRSQLNKSFDMFIFLSGFFGNTIIAILLTWLGNKLNIQLEIAAIVVYGSRLFDNFAQIRRFFIKKKEY